MPPNIWADGAIIAGGKWGICVGVALPPPYLPLKCKIRTGRWRSRWKMANTVSRCGIMAVAIGYQYIRMPCLMQAWTKINARLTSWNGWEAYNFRDGYFKSIASPGHKNTRQGWLVKQELPTTEPHKFPVTYRRLGFNQTLHSSQLQCG